MISDHLRFFAEDCLSLAVTPWPNILITKYLLSPCFPKLLKAEAQLGFRLGFPRLEWDILQFSLITGMLVPATTRKLKAAFLKTFIICSLSGYLDISFFSSSFQSCPTNMERPKFLLFGDSITQQAFAEGGWAASMADAYSRRVGQLLILI